MADYSVIISNGTGQENMSPGTYSAEIIASGYSSSSISPSTFTVTAPPTEQTFTVIADGKVTFTINETGEESGTAITGGTIVMTDITGNIQYGSVKTISSLGVVEFENVPYGTSSEPYVLYFKQLTADSKHKPYEQVIVAELKNQTESLYIKNDLYPVQQILVKDGTYTGLPVNSATISFTKTI